jgi:tetratricopeptide (TPR) repeat protein
MANYLRGLKLAKQEKYAEADRIFDRISTGLAAFWPGYYAQGATKFKLGQYAQAETSLGKYLPHLPNDMKAAQLIATAALQQRAASRAIEYLKPFADKTPADAATLALLGDAYVADRKPDLALQQFQKAASILTTRMDPGRDIGDRSGEASRVSPQEPVFGTEAGAPIADALGC